MDDIDHNALLEEAALWLTRLDSGAAELADFEVWRNADPSHAAAYAQVLAAWKVADRLGKLPNFDEAMGRKPGMSKRHLMTALVTVGGAVAIGGVAYLSLGSGKAKAETAVGDRQTLSLPDGGRLDVNTDSQVTWKYDDRFRNIWLERGEIGLKVVADPRPCRLIGGGRTVEILQGDVNARLRGNVLDLLMISGSCEIRPQGGQASSVIRSGQAALIDEKAERIRLVAETDVAFVSGWRRDELVFNGQPLGSVVSEYNRYLRQKISIADPSLESIRLGGRFSTRDPEVFLGLLRTSFAINVTHDDQGGVILSK